jgi:hypothetical protein
MGALSQADVFAPQISVSAAARVTPENLTDELTLKLIPVTTFAGGYRRSMDRQLTKAPAVLGNRVSVSDKFTPIHLRLNDCLMVGRSHQ